MKSSNCHWYYLCCKIVVCYKPVIIKLQQENGGSIGCDKMRIDRKRRLWRWQVTGRSALLFLKTIYPYLLEKKSQATYCLEVGWRAWEGFHTKNLSKLKGYNFEPRERGNIESLEKNTQLSLVYK